MKSGIELLEELLDQVKLLNKRFEVIDQNVKILLAQHNLSNKPAEIVVNNEPITIKSTVAEPTSPAMIQQAEQTIQSMPVGTARVTGKIKDSEKRLLSGVQVKIYDSHNKVVKSTKTNKAGDWMCFLVPGKYAANYFMEGKVNANAVFHVGPGEKIVRVAPPQI